MHELILALSPGGYVSLVGARGCGKTTAIALVVRFYDPKMEGVFTDGKNISTLNIMEYRKHLKNPPCIREQSLRTSYLVWNERTSLRMISSLRARKPTFMTLSYLCHKFLLLTSD